jgi:hypothetical protein
VETGVQHLVRACLFARVYVGLARTRLRSLGALTRGDRRAASGACVFVCTCICRAGQNHIYTKNVYIYGLCTAILAGILPNIRSYAVYIHGSGQPYVCVMSVALICGCLCVCVCVCIAIAGGSSLVEVGVLHIVCHCMRILFVRDRVLCICVRLCVRWWKCVLWNCVVYVCVVCKSALI